MDERSNIMVIAAFLVAIVAFLAAIDEQVFGASMLVWVAKS